MKLPLLSLLSLMNAISAAAQTVAGILRHRLGNWQSSQLFTFSSAPPTTGTIVVGGTPFPGAAFNGSLNGFGGSTRVPFRPVNSLDLDQFVRVDARITKIISIRDYIRLHLNFEGFNVFNHPRRRT